MPLSWPTQGLLARAVTRLWQPASSFFAVSGARRFLAAIPPPLNWTGTPPKAGHMPRGEKVLLEHVGMSFLVHSGRDYKRVKVTSQMVDHKYGEFVLTRKRRRPDANAAKQKGRSGGKKR